MTPAWRLSSSAGPPPRIASAGKLVEQLGAFAADVLHNRGEADLRIETLAGAQQASLAEIEGVLGAKLSEIEAAFGRCDAALEESNKPRQPGRLKRRVRARGQRSLRAFSFCGSASMSSPVLLYSTVSA